MSFAIFSVFLLLPELGFGKPPLTPQQIAAEKECVAAEQEAYEACQTQSMSAGMTPEGQMQGQQLMAQQQMLNQNVGQIGSQQSNQCGGQADLTKVLGLLSGLKGAACLWAVTSCKSACGGNGKVPPGNGPNPPPAAPPNPVLQTTKMETKSAQCGGLATNAAMALAQAAAMFAASMTNSQCAKEASTNGLAAAAQPIQDCSNPDYARTNVLCICQADPKSSMCQKGEQFPIGLSTSGGPTGPSSPGALTDGLPSDGTPIGLAGGQAKTATGSATTEGGGGGGGGLGGSKGLQGISGGNGDDNARSGLPTAVIQGTSGGGGGGAAGGGIGGGGGSPGPGRSAKAAKDDDKLNLKNLLPRAGRNVAGMSISSQHGITGPLGPSVFEKISSQYQNQLQKNRFIQDR